LDTVTSFNRRLIKGRFKYTQILASNSAGEVPTTDDISPGDLAINFADQKLYSANQNTTFLLAESGLDTGLFVTNTYLQTAFVSNAYANTHLIWNAPGAAIIPLGNNSDRPIPAANGYFRYNEEVGTLECYSNGTWVYVNEPGGPNGSIQFNDSEIYEGSGAFTFDKLTNTVFVSNTLNSAIFFSGNSTVNIMSNATILKLAANSTVMANLSASLFSLGNSFINSVGIGIGANVFLDTTKFVIGNSSANLLANSILLSVSNSTGIANLSPTALVIGPSIVNALGLSVGGTGGMVINTIAFMAGANVLLDMGQLAIGNSSVNTTVNATGFYINGVAVTAGVSGDDTEIQFNDGGFANGSLGLVFNKTSNTLAVSNTIDVGVNVSINTSTIQMGNSTVNLVANSLSLKVGGYDITYTVAEVIHRIYGGI